MEKLEKVKELLKKLTELGYRISKDFLYENELCPITDDDIYKKRMYDFIDTIQQDKIIFNLTMNFLCSIDSGLWQFVCEKGLYNSNDNYGDDYEITNTFLDNKIDCLVNDTYQKHHYNYRLMLSSIQPDKGQFLLDNIVV